MEDDELTTTKSQAVFEFTKRKRWADVLVSELVNVAILVFSQTGAIIHADAAVHAVTGYSEDQLLGKNFSDILHDGDALAFFQAFEDSIAANRELTFYLRIRASDRRDQSIRLVELKANPFKASGRGTTECLCVYAMLAPYPSSSVSDLDDFLALKTENAQLAQRIDALRNGHGDWTDGTLGSDGADSMSEDDFFSVRQTENIVDKSERALAQVSAVLESAAAHNPAIGSYGGIGVDSSGTTSADGPLKKKRRLTELAQGRICTACGRNNSPEWRKGPSGPKSLCNACGLRYAKKSKYKDGDAD